MSIKEFEAGLKKEYARQTGSKDINEKLFHLYVLKRLFQKEVESVYELSESEIYDLLNHIIQWYHKFGSSASPDELLDYKDKIVTCSYWISQKLTEVDRKHTVKSQHNKNEIDRLISQSSNSTGVHAARSTAKNSKSNDLMTEAHYKAEIKRIERLLSSLDSIVSAMQQRIAWLRQEANKTVTF